MGESYTDLDSGGKLIAAAEANCGELEVFAASDLAEEAGLLTNEVRTKYVDLAK